MTSAFYGTRWFAAFPIVFFVGATLYLNVSGAFDSGSMAAAGLVGMMAASFLARDKASYWDAVVEGLRDKTAILVITIFLVVGVYGELMSQARLAEGLVRTSGSEDPLDSTIVLTARRGTAGSWVAGPTSAVLQDFTDAARAGKRVRGCTRAQNAYNQALPGGASSLELTL